MSDPNDMLTPREARKLLKVSRNTMYDLLQSGAIPATRVGIQYRIRRGDLPGQAVPK